MLRLGYKGVAAVDWNGKLTAKEYEYTFVRIVSDDKEPIECFNEELIEYLEY